MLTGPIFSQEEEDEMMNLSDFRDRPRFEDSHEQSRGTVILEGEEEESEDFVVSQAFAPSPHVVPHDYSRQEYEFSFDFSAPTHVYSLQFSPPEDQNLHDGEEQEEESATRGAAALLQSYFKKNQIFLWVAGLAFVVSCGVQQLVLVKNDLATLRLENQQLRLTIETLQQEKLSEESTSEDYAFFQMFEHGLPADTTSKLGECAAEAKNQIYHQLADLKDAFWTTAERVRDVIEDELLGPVAQQVKEAGAATTTTTDEESGTVPWFRNDGFKEKLDKALKQIGGAKIVLPVLLASGAAVAAEWFWNNEE